MAYRWRYHFFCSGNKLLNVTRYKCIRVVEYAYLFKNVVK